MQAGETEVFIPETHHLVVQVPKSPQLPAAVARATRDRRWFRLPAAVLALALGFGQGAARAELSGSWSSLPVYPTPISNNAVASVCGPSECTLFSFMGIVDTGDPSTITPSSFKLTSASPGPAWEPIADAPLLGGRAKIAASAIVVAGEVYLIGGYSVSSTGFETTEHRLFRYDQTGDFYEQLSDVPTEVDDTVVGTLDDHYIYLVSGWHGPINNNTMAVQVYDTQTDEWAQATPIPPPGRFGHAGGLVDGRLIFIDGAQVPGSNFPLVHSTWVGTLDPNDRQTVTWIDTGPSPFSGTYRAASSQNLSRCARVLFVGGSDNTYNISGMGYDGQPSLPLDQVMVFDPRTRVWEQVDDTNGLAWTPTMDHRGLVEFGGRWVTVGGMTAPLTATDAVNALSVEGLCETLFRDGFESGDTSAWTASMP